MLAKPLVYRPLWNGLNYSKMQVGEMGILKKINLKWTCVLIQDSELICWFYQRLLLLVGKACLNQVSANRCSESIFEDETTAFLVEYEPKTGNCILFCHLPSFWSCTHFTGYIIVTHYYYYFINRDLLSKCCVLWPALGCSSVMYVEEDSNFSFWGFVISALNCLPNILSSLVRNKVDGWDGVIFDLTNQIDLLSFIV